MVRQIQKLATLTIFSLIVIFTNNTLLPSAHAAACNFDKQVLGIPVWYKYLKSDPATPSECRIVLEGVSDALPIGLAVFEGALTIAGFVAVAMIFVGGFKYVLAQGESDRAANGRKTVMNAIIGLVIVIIAARVVGFIGSSLG